MLFCGTKTGLLVYIWLAFKTAEKYIFSLSGIVEKVTLAFLCAIPRVWSFSECSFCAIQPASPAGAFLQVPPTCLGPGTCWRQSSRRVLSEALPVFTGPGPLLSARRKWGGGGGRGAGRKRAGPGCGRRGAGGGARGRGAGQVRVAAGGRRSPGGAGEDAVPGGPGGGGGRARCASGDGPGPVFGRALRHTPTGRGGSLRCPAARSGAGVRAAVPGRGLTRTPGAAEASQGLGAPGLGCGGAAPARGGAEGGGAPAAVAAASCCSLEGQSRASPRRVCLIDTCFAFSSARNSLACHLCLLGLM